MTKPLQTHHRVVGALVGSWLALALSSVLLLGFAYFTVPLAAAFGATRSAQRLARPALALTGGVATGSFVGSAVAIGPASILLMAVAAGVLWWKLDDLNAAERSLRPARV